LATPLQGSPPLSPHDHIKIECEKITNNNNNKDVHLVDYVTDWEMKISLCPLLASLVLTVDTHLREEGAQKLVKEGVHEVFVEGQRLERFWGRGKRLFSIWGDKDVMKRTRILTIKESHTAAAGVLASDHA